MENKDFVRIKHMLDSIDAVLDFVKGKTRADLDNSRLLCSGIIRELEILGEAAGQVSKEFRNQYPALPWKQLTGMRNRLIHAYFNLDYDIIWKTVQDHLPKLRAELQAICKS